MWVAEKYTYYSLWANAPGTMQADEWGEEKSGNRFHKGQMLVLTTKSAVSEDGVLVNRALLRLSGGVELFFYKYLQIDY